MKPYFRVMLAFALVGVLLFAGCTGMPGEELNSSEDISKVTIEEDDVNCYIYNSGDDQTMSCVNMNGNSPQTTGVGT